ncbi:protein fem-1 homolog B-like [Myzus persicae]|uniref:protein fem-1 homolog B-like n=1 Tax=Myzus persicae TaxID=13164 RepID=UPI000B932D25|nr:protein fem-1 homolog B-like [Myzus persicae]XP_022173058.1 protein fem-1 homolog B-like [Myzus persicae]XP_022173060.1 protein fem-1 homolog B-like [Myzus persicae]
MSQRILDLSALPLDIADPFYCHSFPSYSRKLGTDKEFLRIRFAQTMNLIARNEVADSDHIINGTYASTFDQKFTLLIEASLNSQLKIVKELFRRFNVAVDNTGDVVQFGSLIKGATALWCAAGSGAMEIVKILVENGANVNFLTETKSSPLRAACYLGHLNIVEYLVEHGANVNLTNIYNSTCLMIASHNNHKDVVEYLLRKGADINVQTKCGSTAMHFAAQADNLEIAKLLIEFNAQQLKNQQSLTPILVAAERTHHNFVYCLIDEMSQLNLTREEKIDAEELLGASFLNDKDHYDFQRGYNILVQAMKKRYEKHPIINKKVNKTVECYNYKVECQTVQELLDIKDNAEAIHFESLIIRERILGENNPDLLQSLIYRGAVYADAQNFTPCVLLWNHALKIANHNKHRVHIDLLRFTQVFCQMIKNNIKIKLSDLKNILQTEYDELVFIKKKISSAADFSTEKDIAKDEYYAYIRSTLGLIIITSMALFQNDNNEDPLVGELMKVIVEINRLELKTNKGLTLLHLSLNYDTHIDNIFTTGICCFPNFLAMKLLVHCGANVDEMDNENNTALHYIGKFITDFPHIPHDTDFLDTRKMVLELLNAGAHTDFVNKSGDCPYTGYLSSVFHLTNNTPRSLKCLSACAVKNKLPKYYYRDKLPKILLKFTFLH